MSSDSEHQTLPDFGFGANIPIDTDLKLAQVESVANDLRQKGMAHAEGGLNVADGVIRGIENKAKRYTKKTFDAVQGMINEMGQRGMNHADGKLLEAQMIANSFAEKAGNAVGSFGRGGPRNLPNAVQVGDDGSNYSSDSRKPDPIPCDDGTPPHLVVMPARREYRHLWFSGNRRCWQCFPYQKPDQQNDWGLFYSYRTWYACELAWLIKRKTLIKDAELMQLSPAIDQIGLYTGQPGGQVRTFQDFINSGGK